MDLSKEIETILESKFQPKTLNIYNDSYKHAGHRPAGESINSHFRIEINKNFIEGTLIEKHRAIMTSLEKYMDNPIHAVEIKLID